MFMNRKRSIHITISLLLLASLLSTTFFVTTHAEAKAKTDAQEFHDAMRKLWEDHITWTRMVIVGYLADPDATLPDLQESVNRLLQNQVDIGNAIKPYYGEEAGNQLTALLTDHILIAAEILEAAKAGDDAAVAEAAARWYTNADEIAAFLNSANPGFWPLDEMTQMMHDHLDLTLQEATTYLSSDYAGSVAAYEQVHLEILEMADMLSDGIIRQFPKQFK